MPASFVRLIAFAAIVAAVALAVPRFAPGLLASYFRDSQTAVAIPVAAPKPLGGRKVAIDADPRGHFVTDAVVEGRTITVVVDTGATTVALTADTARRLGLKLMPADFTAQVSTANGIASAARVMLSEVRVGGITVHEVAAIVVPGDALEVNLLGMTFLSRLRKFEVGGGQLVLTE